jgi:hypothetical protein
MSGNSKAILALGTVQTAARFGITFAAKSADLDPRYWDGFATAMRAVEEHTARLLEELHRQDEAEAAQVVTNVIDLAERRRTS